MVSCDYINQVDTLTAAPQLDQKFRSQCNVERAKIAPNSLYRRLCHLEIHTRTL